MFHLSLCRKSMLKFAKAIYSSYQWWAHTGSQNTCLNALLLWAKTCATVPLGFQTRKFQFWSQNIVKWLLKSQNQCDRALLGTKKLSEVPFWEPKYVLMWPGGSQNMLKCPHGSQMLQMLDVPFFSSTPALQNACAYHCPLYVQQIWLDYQ